MTKCWGRNRRFMFRLHVLLQHFLFANHVAFHCSLCSNKKLSQMPLCDVGKWHKETGFYPWSCGTNFAYLNFSHAFFNLNLSRSAVTFVNWGRSFWYIFCFCPICSQNISCSVYSFFIAEFTFIQVSFCRLFLLQKIFLLFNLSMLVKKIIVFTLIP